MLRYFAAYFGHILQYDYAVFMYSYSLWMIRCHFIVLDIILMTYPWSPFLNSNFVFLAALLLSFYL